MQTITAIDIPYRATPESYFAAIRQLPEAIWLDSGKPRSLQGRFDLMSAAPDLLLENRNGTTTISENGTTRSSLEDPFLLTEQCMAPLLPVDPSWNHYPFVGGLIGYFSYDAARQLGTLPEQASAVCDLPDIRLGRYLWALVTNHQAQHSHLFFHARCPAELQKQIKEIIRNAPQETPASDNFQLAASFQATTDYPAYSAAVTRIKEYIAAGDCYQANYAQHFSAPFQGDPWHAYLQLRNVAASPYSAFWQWHDQALLSLSPERFIKCSVNQVETKPIKGTIQRGGTLNEDQDNAITLLNSSKDRAENLMIVDLMRNDLGRSCQPGSIRVPKLFALESFPNVHHLVSTVTGTLSTDKSPLDLLRGCFPGGSITGTPKRRAMEIIEELEPVRRSLYCGSIGYLSATGRLDTSIAIRTLVADRGTLHCWGGGGIVADSDVASEYRESLLKIRLFLNTLEQR